MSETSELIRRGGWALDDVQARHRAHPDTFALPPARVLEPLDQGAAVRLIFEVLDQADPVRDGQPPYGDDGKPNLTVQHERMWLWVERLEGDELVGILQNAPLATHTLLVPNARVRFRRTDVIEVDLDHADLFRHEVGRLERAGFPVLDEAAVLAPEDPGRAPSIASSQADACARAGARPERPWPFARLLVGKGVAPGTFPLYGARTAPKPERGDCGWTLWSGDPDLEKASKAHGFEIVEVKDLFRRHREAWDHLALPPGWAFVLGPDGWEDVYEDPSLLAP